MTTVFDTLAFSRRLQQASFTSAQSDALADAVHDAVRGSVATKADLGHLGDTLRVDMEKLRVEFEKLRVDMEKLRAELLLVKWMIGFMLAGTASLVVKAFF